MELAKMRTINQIAEIFGLPKHFVRKSLPHVVHVKSGRKFLINEQKFNDWLNTGVQCKQAESLGNSKIRKIHEEGVCT